MRKTPPRVMCLLAAAGLTAALATTALAKPPGPPRGHGAKGGPPGGPNAGPGMLLRIPEVRDELSITDEQDDQLRQLHREFGKKMRSEMHDRMRQAREDGMDRREARDAMREVMEGFRKEGKAKLAEILDPAQLQRLEQIHTQHVIKHRGFRGLLRGPLGEELGLTEDQQEMLRERGRELQKELREKMKAARDEARQQLLEVLTSEQRQQLEGMMGEPFDLPPPPEGRRHGRRRGGPDGPPEGGRRGGQRQGPPGPPPGDEL